MVCLPLVQISITVTPDGVHCPTAKVQQVFDQDANLMRAPEKGEAEFTQCHCAEKKAAEKSGEATIKRGSAELMPISSEQNWAGCPHMPIFDRLSPIAAVDESLDASPDKAPPTPPPCLI